MKLHTQPRKIVNLGYSFFVSLPIDWVRSMELSRRDFLQPEIQENGDLLLKPIRREVENDPNT